jgi:acetolactate synthase-1/2/3 large subunit
MTATTTTSVGGLIAGMLAECGTRHFFLLTGGDNAFFGELLARDIDVVLARSERSAAFMADAYSRLTGRPAFVYGQFGPGAAVVLSGLVDAYLGNSPVVAIASEVKTDVAGTAAYQELDQQALFKPVVKWGARLERADRTSDMLRAAISRSIAGCPGPTYLGVPSDMLLEPVATPPAGRYADTGAASVPAHRPQASISEARKIADILTVAKRPVVLAGGGAILSGAYAECGQLAELLDIPVVTTAAGKGAISEQHSLAIGVAGRYSRVCANSVLKQADVVLALGTRLNDMTTDRGRVIDQAARVLQVDVDPSVLGRNWPVAAVAHADVASFLGQLQTLLAPVAEPLRSGWSEWAQSCRSTRDAWLVARAEVECDIAGQLPISPVHVMRVLRETLGNDDVVVADTGYMAAWTSALYDVRDAGRGHLRTAGSLGWGLPASLGAQLALGPAGRAICVTGDGGIGYHFTEIETAVRLGLPVVIVLLNNGTLAFERHVQKYELDAEYPALNDFADVDYAAAARAFGADGETVVDPADLGPALRRALKHDGPTLIDVRTDPAVLAPVTNYEAFAPRVL